MRAYLMGGADIAFRYGFRSGHRHSGSLLSIFGREYRPTWRRISLPAAVSPLADAHCRLRPLISADIEQMASKMLLTELPPRGDRKYAIADDDARAEYRIGRQAGGGGRGMPVTGD